MCSTVDKCILDTLFSYHKREKSAYMCSIHFYIGFILIVHFSFGHDIVAVHESADSKRGSTTIGTDIEKHMT